ncbi:MAG: NAD-dependent epimerase/dehydratase family protein [candidate division Zixibacteria bacterium]
MKVAVTGAGGFLGKALVARLRNSEFEPLAIVKKEPDSSVYGEKGIDSICRDLTEKDACAGLFKDCHAVVHCAVMRRDYGKWEDFKRTNIDLTRLVMEYAAKAEVKKVIHISTVAVYGNDHSHFGTDEDADYGERVVDHYTRSKIEADKIVSALIDDKNFPAVILRPGYIWGPGDKAIIPFVINNLKSKRLFFADDGSNLLSLTYIENVVEAIMIALRKEDAVGKTFNITDGSKVSSSRFVNDIIAILGIDYKPRHVQYTVLYTAAYLMEIYYRLVRRSSIPHLTRFAARFLKYDAIFDISRAIYDLGYQPKYSYKEGMTILTPYLRSLYYGGKKAQTEDK